MRTTSQFLTRSLCSAALLAGLAVSFSQPQFNQVAHAAKGGQTDFQTQINALQAQIDALTALLNEQRQFEIAESDDETGVPTMQNRRSITLKSVVATLLTGLIGTTVALHPGFAKGKPGGGTTAACTYTDLSGFSGAASNGTRSWAFVCPANGSLTALPDFGGDSAAAMAINDAGVIVGWARYPRKGNTIRQVGVIWKNGVVTDLNKLASVGSTNNLHEALGINSAGQITGTIYLDGISEIHGYVLTPR